MSDPFFDTNILIDYLIGLKPRRIIINPGTENADFVRRAEAAGIEAVGPVYAATPHGIGTAALRPGPDEFDLRAAVRAEIS